MNATIKKLPKSVQTLICASNQINNYTKAVQELVFNALDAYATSIAVRIDISEGSIQVVDNGCGIAQADFKYVGQNYMTSKLVDISTLKSAPNKYGFQGQSLANLAQISESLKVTSRFYKCETTCVKIFDKGRTKSIMKSSSRPSKGTTVEIKGFLYNLNIQKKSVNLINELQNIKSSLEHISLVHSNISLSLRDNSRNEIVYKIHKNRDVYQTLSTLYEINKTNVQELQVEKKQYKVKAYVGKGDVEIRKQLIFLNGKCINDSSLLHKKVNENFKKNLKGNKKKIKRNVNVDEETHIFGNNIPFYFIFITCPYMDYDLTNTILEFKSWGQVNTILDKLVKFYMGDIQLHAVSKNQIPKIVNKRNSESTRNHIEEIMHKILGSHGKKPAISQMRNGVTGKLIKRKHKNRREVSKTANPKTLKKGKEVSKQGSSERALIDEQFSNKNDTNVFDENPKPKVRKKIPPNSKNKPPKRLNHATKTYRQPTREKINLNEKFAMETESVKQRCKLLAEETEKLIKNNKRNHLNVLINENVQYTSSNFVKDNKNIAVRTKVNEIVIHEYIPLPLKINIGKADNDDQFKSNYDLLQTILNTQKELKETARINAQGYVVSSITESNNYNLKDKKNDTVPFRAKESSNISSLRGQRLYSNFDQARESHNYDDRISIPTDTPEYNLSLIREPDTTNTLESNIRPYLNRLSDDKISPFETVTFQSHNYEQVYRTETDVELFNFHKKPRNFITTQSRENFKYFLEDKLKTNKINWIPRLFKSKNHKRKINKFTKMFNMEKNVLKGIQESYTIEFTDSNDNNEYTSMNNLRNRQEMIKLASEKKDLNGEAVTPLWSYNFSEDRQYQCMPQMNPKTCFLSENNNEKDSEPLRNTYTVTNSYGDSHIQISLDYSGHNWNVGRTYTIEGIDKSRYNTYETNKYSDDNKNRDYVFVSKSQENDDGQQITNPMDVCETILQDQDLSTDREREFDTSFNYIQTCCNKLDTTGKDAVEMVLINEMNDNMDNNVINNLSCEQNDPTKSPSEKAITETSHHFTVPNSNIFSPILIQKQDPICKVQLDELISNNRVTTTASEFINEKHNMGAFNMRNRICFVPKGMSPIFKKCETKPDCEFDPKEDYYTDKMYNDFLDKVQNDAEVYKPRIRDSSDLTTKDINKVNSKLNKDNASLKFDGKCLKNAKVLGQVDSKFIAAIMKSKSHKPEDFEEFLVLFDQHAVHERIRLENNLADYLSDSQWKSVTIDEVSLKMSRDDILYLHNYRDKFMQFGLQWNILNYNEISISAIPEGILGKHPRQVDKILKAVKNLVTEEIYNIQKQRGCVSLYPKSIMELVFSEACRYAIKFGDHLPKTRCIELLNALSDCKTPFQCAHGRPAMAVIMNIEDNRAEYKMNFKKIQQFKMFNVNTGNNEE